MESPIPLLTLFSVYLGGASTEGLGGGVVSGAGAAGAWGAEGSVGVADGAGVCACPKSEKGSRHSSSHPVDKDNFTFFLTQDKGRFFSLANADP